MDREQIIDILAECRAIKYSLWEDYHEKAKESSCWKWMRDTYEMDVRALDFAMEALRHDTV